MEYRQKAGPLGYQLEKADDHHRALRAALDAPDIAEELATALRDLLRYHDACGVESGTGDAARTVLRRYNDSREPPA